MDINIPGWCTYLSINQRDEGSWSAYIIGDPRGTGVAQSGVGHGADPKEAMNNAADAAEGWSSYRVEQKP
jgi:predicted RNase H-like HicB family nuclease